MIVEKYIEKCIASRKGSAARSLVTTRVHSVRRSQRENASIPARTSGREQPSGPGSGSAPYPNRGVAHAPTDSAGCERRAADGTKRRPPERPRHSLEVAGAVTDPTAGFVVAGTGVPRRGHHSGFGVRRQPPRFVAAPLAASAVHIGVWKPARKDRPEIHQRRRQNSGRNSRGDRRILMALTRAPTPFQRGVSDHVAGRGLGRPSGHFGWSLTPRDCCWRPLRQWCHQAGGIERRPMTAGRNLRGESPLSSALAARETSVATCGGAFNTACPGGTPRARALFPLRVPPRSRQAELGSVSARRHWPGESGQPIHSR